MTPAIKSTTTVPYFKLDGGKFYLETAGLSDDLVGMYIRMMIIYWEDECTLPNDELLKIKLGVRGKKATDNFNLILAQFFGGERRTHDLLNQGLAEVNGHKAKQSANAKAGWEKRKAAAEGVQASGTDAENCDF